MQSYLCHLMELYEIIYVLVALYILYKLVFNFIVPALKISTAVRDKMQQGQASQPTSNAAKQASATTKKSSAHDNEYIDFEEIK